MHPDAEVNKHRETFDIRSSEVYPSQKAKLSSLCNLMQEVAGNHARMLDFDIMSLREKDLTWVLHRLHVQIDRYPEWRDRITIETWPSSGDALRAYRDFVLLDENGNEIGKALSYWIMLNTENRRPVRMPEKILDMAPRDITHVLPVRRNRVDLPGELTFDTTFKVRKGDLDVNEHLNNVKYIEWALEVVDSPLPVHNLDIEFRSECHNGDEVKAGSLMTKEEVIYAMKRGESDEIVSVARTSL